MRKNADHHLTALLFLIDLVTYNACHSPLLGSQQNGICRTAAYQICIKRLRHKIGYPKIISPFNIDRRILCGNNHHRNRVDPVLLIHICKHFKSIHLGHHKIKKDQRKLLCMLLQISHCLHPVLHLHNIIFIFQNCCQNIPVHLRIICDKNLLLLLYDCFTHLYVLCRRGYPPPALFSQFSDNS